MLWRQVHRTSLALYIFATFHGVQAGTDTGNVWYQMIMLASINVVAFLVVLLILTHRRNRQKQEQGTSPRPVAAAR